MYFVQLRIAPQNPKTPFTLIRIFNNLKKMNHIVGDVLLKIGQLLIYLPKS